ncbi:crossover junction endonuclease MUS81 isoform X1 [Agrilus planipennis]|uniref:Crossover junction endonuclease MUS81 n=1 Tax=Agrilus planipennis TaxID=224129 RepID=A0A1W4X632_AGRPL|nr:crossover junction endonuclease MUS81 isoform X1 [Agrilus planipennis]
MNKINRVSVKHVNPNPLFTKWLTEWRDDALERRSKLYNTFNFALKNLSKFPLPLRSGKDCKIIKGFGKQLCEMLDKKLQESRSENVSRKSCKTNHEYIPAYRSGAYAILLTLYSKSLEANFQGYLTKPEIIELGQHFCDKSFSKPNPGTYNTCWSSMKILLSKNLAVKNGSPARYSLTEEGRNLGARLSASSNNGDHSNCLAEPYINRLRNSKNEVPIFQNNTEFKRPVTNENMKDYLETDMVSFTPKSFDVVLLVDCKETLGSLNVGNDPIINGLVAIGVNHEIRHLKVGDYTWICRERESKRELVLPYIVERKRLDDLGSSIKDGRFHEQKFRLRRCGLGNVIYLIESFGSTSHLGLPITSLYQAVANTLVQDEFSVKFTDGTSGSLQYLASMTKTLTKLFKDKTLMSRPKETVKELDINEDLIPLMWFQEFHKCSHKRQDRTVTEMFICQLLQVKGISLDKALSIVERYPTPKHLKNAYEKCSYGERLLSTMQYGKLKKNMGLALSRTVYLLYTNKFFH